MFERMKEKRKIIRNHHHYRMRCHRERLHSYEVRPHHPHTRDWLFDAAMMSDETIRSVPEISSLKEKHVPEDAAIRRSVKDRVEICVRRWRFYREDCPPYHSRETRAFVFVTTPICSIASMKTGTPVTSSLFLIFHFQASPLRCSSPPVQEKMVQRLKSEQHGLYEWIGLPKPTM